MELSEIKSKIEPFYKKHAKVVAPFSAPEKGEPYIMGLGANTFFVGDGESSFFIDAYLTRNCFRLPIDFGAKMLVSSIESKPDIVKAHYKAIGAPSFSHIICTHNHVDHTLDLRALYDACKAENDVAPKIVGTLSSVNTALGYDVPREDTVIVHRKKHGYESIEIGKFKITFLPGKHLKLFALYKSTYRRKPLRRKGFITAYKEGGVLDLLIEHEGMKSLLLTSSFGIGEYTLKAEIGTLVQAIGGSLKETKRFKKALFKHNAVDTKARRVLLTHYDDFFIPFSRGLRFVNVTEGDAEQYAKFSEDAEVGLLKLFEKIKL